MLEWKGMKKKYEADDQSTLGSVLCIICNLRNIRNYPDHEKPDNKRLIIQTIEKIYGSYEDAEWKETRERHSPKTEWLLGSSFWSNNHNTEHGGVLGRTIHYVFLSVKLTVKFEEIQIKVYSPNPAAVLLVESKMGAIAMVMHQQLQNWGGGEGGF